MKAITNFSLRALSEPPLSRMHESYLQFNNEPAGMMIQGIKIEHQFSCADGYLLITSYDYLEGTSYWFYYLNSNFKVLDLISPQDVFGFIENLKIIDDHQLEFNFWEETQSYRLVILQTPVWRLWRGVALSLQGRRPVRFIFSKQYMKLINL